jgi:hypothetical protein
LTKRSSYPQLHSQIRFPVQQVVQDQNEGLVKETNRLFPMIEALNTLFCKPTETFLILKNNQQKLTQL